MIQIKGKIIIWSISMAFNYILTLKRVMSIFKYTNNLQF